MSIEQIGNNDDDREPTRKQYVFLSIAVVISLISLLIAATIAGHITQADAQIATTGVLAAATFGYLVITYWMAASMEKSAEQSKKLVKLTRQDDIIQIIQNEINPVIEELREHRDEFDARGKMNAYDAWGTDPMFHRLPELDSKFRGSADAAMMDPEINVDRGLIVGYYHKLDDYTDKHREAVHELTVIIAQDNSLNINRSRAQDYARSALAIEPVGDISRNLWNNSKDDVIPLRSQITTLTDELLELKAEMKRDGQEIRRQLEITRAQLMDEFYITRTALND